MPPKCSVSHRPQYMTTIARQGTLRMARPEVSSLVFDREGRFRSRTDEVTALLRTTSRAPAGGHDAGTCRQTIVVCDVLLKSVWHWQHHVPTLYSLNDPYPIATFSGKHLPNGERVLPGDRTYSNCCTMKVGTLLSITPPVRILTHSCLCSTVALVPWGQTETPTTQMARTTSARISGRCQRSLP